MSTDLLTLVCQNFASQGAWSGRTLTPVTLATVRPDGRNLRAVKTRAAIIAAHRTLLELRELGPTTSRIAEVAGVSPRTLFVHFADLETLFAATADDLLADVMARNRRL